MRVRGREALDETRRPDAVERVLGQHRVRDHRRHARRARVEARPGGAQQHFGVTPDMVVLGKALGGGVLPLAAVIAEERLDIAPELSIGHYTHEKNPLLARVALTLLDVVEEGGLVEDALARGRKLEQLLHGQAAGGFRLALRGLGLFRALAFEGASTGKALLERAALAAGLSATAKDEISIGVSLPLITSDDDIRMVAERLLQMTEALGSPAGR